MHVDFSGLNKQETYQLMTETIIPRPIAWVLSENENETFNLAPFSYFNAIASRPALFSISIGYRPDGGFKDTRRNLEARNDFVLHIPSVSQAKMVTESSKPFPTNVSEIEELGLDVVRDFKTTHLPRLSHSLVAYHCRYHQTFELGVDKQGLLIGEIISAFVDDAIVGPGLHCSAEKIDPLGRLGGNDYASLGQIQSVQRAPYKP